MEFKNNWVSGCYTINLGTERGQFIHRYHLIILPLIPIMILLIQNYSTYSANQVMIDHRQLLDFLKRAEQYQILMDSRKIKTGRWWGSFSCRLALIDTHHPVSTKEGNSKNGDHHKVAVTSLSLHFWCSLLHLWLNQIKSLLHLHFYINSGF